jgi:hypothetical protein
LPISLAISFCVQQQLAGAGRVRVNVGRGGLERGDVHADDEDLGAADHHVAFLDVGAPGANGLDLPSLQHEAGFVLVLDEVIVEGLAVVDDAHWRRFERRA